MADECEEDFEQNDEKKANFEENITNETTHKNAVEEFLESRTQLFNLPFRFDQQQLDSTTTSALKRLNQNEVEFQNDKLINWNGNLSGYSLKFDNTSSKRIKKDNKNAINQLFNHVNAQNFINATKIDEITNGNFLNLFFSSKNCINKPSN